MKCDRVMPVWPLLATVTILFVLSVRAPREWHRVAIVPLDHGAIAGAAADTAGVELHTSALTAPLVPLTDQLTYTESLMDSYATDRHLAPQSVAVAKAGTVAAPAAMDPLPGPPGGNPVAVARVTDGGSEAVASQQLEHLATGPRPAEIGPAVARLYDSSPSLAETVAPSVADLDPDSSGTFQRSADPGQAPADPDQSGRIVQRRIADARNIRSWPQSPGLAARLDALSELAPQLASWCGQVQEQLQTLSGFDTLAADAIGESLEQLGQLVASGQTGAEQSLDPSIRNDWARCVHALRRRLGLWQRIHDLAAAEDFPVSITLTDSLPLQQVLDQLDAKLGKVTHRSAWQAYLQTTATRHLLEQPAELDSARTRQLAQQILRRMEYARLTPEQREFLQQPEFLAYSQQLKHLAAEPVDYFRLMQELEQYEVQCTAERAAWLSAAQQDLRWSQEEQVVRLGQELDGQYRNANLRLAISADLINRLLPPSQPLQQPIDETIMGVRARGCSETVTRLRVVMLPGDGAWQMRLQADGEVASRTYAAQGPARFFTRGLSRFAADKRVTLHPGGVRQQSAEVVANSRTGLAGLQTGVDTIPLLGDLVQVLAARQYESRAPAAESIAENRLAWYIGETIDEQVRQAIDQLQTRFVQHVYGPMQQLHLNPVALEMRTTEQRMITRYRLAGYHQLAAHTPRPLAPGNSLLSLQIHESALNNVIEQFGWQGRRVSLREMVDQLSELFALPGLQVPEDSPEDVMIRFAERNPLRISFDEGRVTFTLGLAELSQGRNRWRNFVVRVHYQPAADQPQVDLVRDQYVELMGRLALRDQLALRGIFSRVFSRDKPIDLISRRLAEDPRLQGLELTQLEIGDGWLAMAIGPAADQAAIATRPTSSRPASSRAAAAHSANLFVR